MILTATNIRINHLRKSEPDLVRLLANIQILMHPWVRGIGWVDAALLTACVAWPCRFWTRDKKLADIARELGIG
jgi:predicted nucleic acid-binding protein